MALTKKQIKTIQEIIDRRFLSFTYEALGDSVLTSDELDKLKRAGLIRSNVRNMVADAHTLGKVMALLPISERAGTNFDSVLRAAKKMKPMTGVEKQAVEYAKEKAGVYIKGLKDDMIRRVTAETARTGETALRRIQDGVKQAIVNRETRSELASNLFNIIDNKGRDWLRVAHTEINGAIQNGVYREIRDASDDGAEQLVYKRPNPDACVHCKRVYLQSDGVTPKIFKLSQLADTNVGLKARDWLPTIGSVHPWCNCQLMVVPEGHDFVKRPIAKEKLNTSDKNFNVGQVIPNEIFDKLTDEQKTKTAYDAILEYTGTTGAPIKKSELLRSDIEDVMCNCDH
jgi:hypothetical protein